MDAVVLEGADEFEAGAVADVGEARVLVPAEVPLEDAAVGRAVEDGAPGFELADPGRGFLRVELRHPPVVDVLPAAHGVGEVDLPVVALVHVRQRRGDPALGHDRVRLAEQRLAHEPDRHSDGGRFNGGAEPRAAGPYDDDVVLLRLVVHRRACRREDGDARGCGGRATPPSSTAGRTSQRT